MPKHIPHAHILFQDSHPGLAQLSYSIVCKEGQSYHDAVAEAVDLPNIVYGWRASREDIPAGSVAYHPIFGEVVYGYHWYLHRGPRPAHRLPRR